MPCCELHLLYADFIVAFNIDSIWCRLVILSASVAMGRACRDGIRTLGLEHSRRHGEHSHSPRSVGAAILFAILTKEDACRWVINGKRADAVLPVTRIHFVSVIGIHTEAAELIRCGIVKCVIAHFTVGCSLIVSTESVAHFLG